MNMDKILGLYEVIRDQARNYAKSETGIGEEFLAVNHLVSENGDSDTVIVSIDTPFSYILTTVEGYSDAVGWMGVKGGQLSAAVLKQFTHAQPNHYEGYLDGLGYDLVAYYPCQSDARFINVMYQRINSSQPWVYAVVQRYVGK